MHFPTLDPGRHDFEAIVMQMISRVVKAFVVSLRQSFLNGLKGRQYLWRRGGVYAVRYLQQEEYGRETNPYVFDMVFDMVFGELQLYCR